jgi:HEAT repeat protein
MKRRWAKPVAVGAAIGGASRRRTRNPETEAPERSSVLLKRMNLQSGKVGLGLFLFILVTVVLTTKLLPRQPEYLKRPLSYWIDELGSSDSDSARAAANALKAMGPKAVGFLGHSINWQTSLLYPAYRTAWLNLPGVLERRLPRPEARTEVLNSSFLALTLIGPPAVPTLAKQLQNRDVTVRFYATIALAIIGKPAVPALITQLGAFDARARHAAAEALAVLGPRASAAVVPLTARLHDRNPQVRAEAAFALETIGTDSYDVRLRLLIRVAEDAKRINPADDIHGYLMRLSYHPERYREPGISEILSMLQRPDSMGTPVDAANAVLIPDLVKRLGNSNAAIRYEAAAVLVRVKQNPLLRLEFDRAVVFGQLVSTNAMARQEAAFALWQEAGSGGMIEKLIQELRNASDLETGKHILWHFAEMGGAIEPFIPSISNIVNRSEQLRSLSNQVSRLSAKTN